MASTSSSISSRWSRIENYLRRRPNNNKILNLIYAGVFVSLGVFAIFTAILSLRWHLIYDTPVLLYMGYLMERLHYVPYRDFFEINLPGTMLIAAVLGKITGYSELALRIFDLAYLCGLSMITWLITIRFGKRVAVSAVIAFGLAYLAGGAYFTAQRETFILFGLAVAIYLACNIPRLNDLLRCAIIGLLFGYLVLIKPHSGIGLPPIWVFCMLEVRERLKGSPRKRFWFLPYALVTGVGLLLPTIVAFIYLWQNNALTRFFEILTYLPLFTNITGSLGVLAPQDRITYLIQNTLIFGHNGVWWIPAIVGVSIALYYSKLESAAKRQVVLMAILAVLYVIYAIIGGQFLTYHWLPFTYLIVLLATLCFVQQPDSSNQLKEFLAAGAFLIILPLGGVRFSYDFALQISNPTLDGPKLSRVYEIADYLKQHLNPGDKVQPLNWADGVHHAMLMAQAEIGTSFIFDYQFYYFVSDPRAIALRERFISEMRASRPRFVVEIPFSVVPRASGPDTTDKFEALSQLLATDYHVVKKGDTYVIYELN